MPELHDRETREEDTKNLQDRTRGKEGEEEEVLEGQEEKQTMTNEDA